MMKKQILRIFASALVLMCLSQCKKEDKAVETLPAENDATPALPSSTFVLVHGAWQSPYVWESVKKNLEAKGQKVIVVELQGHGADKTSPANLSIDVYKENVISSLKDVKEKIILIGHSMGGVVISAVAEQIPERIQKLIYVGAFVPKNGQSLLDLANQDKQSILGPSLIPSQDQLTLDVKRENITSIFCQDASKDQQDLMLAKFASEPAIPFTNKAVLTDSRFGKVEKYYIHTLLDHAVGMELQSQMVQAANIVNVFSINTGHSPFLSKGDELANLLFSFTK